MTLDVIIRIWQITHSAAYISHRNNLSWKNNRIHWKLVISFEYRKSAWKNQSYWSFICRPESHKLITSIIHIVVHFCSKYIIFFVNLILFLLTHVFWIMKFGLHMWGFDFHMCKFQLTHVSHWKKYCIF